MKKNTTCLLTIIFIAAFLYLVLKESELNSKFIAFTYVLIPSLITLYLNEKIKGEIKNNFDQKIESLKHEHSLELTNFSTELNALKTKENFKFTKLHEKRMEVLEETYKYLVNTIKTLDQYVSPIKAVSTDATFEENEMNLHENYRSIQNEFAYYFAENRIYFDDETEEMIDNYMKTSTGIFEDYYHNHYLKQFNLPFNPEIHVKANLAYKKISLEIVPVEKQIKQKFKELLGTVL